MRVANRLIMTAALGALCAAPITASAQDSAGRNSASASDKRVTIKVDGADLRAALKLLFASAGLNYSLDSAVQGIVTVSLDDVPFRAALESVLRSTQSAIPLTYRIEDGVYHITVRTQEPAEVIGGPVIDIPADKPRKSAVKINLNWADVRDIVAAFGGTMLESRASQMAGGGFGNGMGSFGGFGGFGGYGGFGGFNSGFGNSGFGFGNGGALGASGGNFVLGPFQGGFNNSGSGSIQGGFRRR